MRLMPWRARRDGPRAGLGLPHQLWIVQAGIFLNALGWGAVLPFEIIYLHNGRGFSLGVAGSVIGVVTGLAVVASPAAGPVIDRWGARATAVGGGIALAAGYGGLAAASRPWQAFAAAAAAGIGNGALQPSQSALLTALAPQQLRHRVIAVSRVATNVGFGLGGGLGGLVAAHGLGGLVALFLGNAASYLLYVAVLVWAVAKEPPAEPMAGGYRSVLRDGRFVWLAGINVAIITVGWGYFSWVVPQYAHADLGVSPAHIGLLLLADAFTVAIAQIPVSRALEGRRRTTAIAISGLIFTGSFLLITAASWTRAGPAFAALLIAAVACGIGECFHTTALMPLVADMAPAALRGRYMAAMSLSWWIGLALAPTVGTRLLAVSPAASLLPAAGLALVASVAALALGQHLPAGIGCLRTVVWLLAGGDQRSAGPGDGRGSGAGQRTGDIVRAAEAKLAEIGPVLDAIAAGQAGRLGVVKLNIDENPRTAQKYEILLVPTLNLFRGGEVVKQVIGAKSKSALLREFAEFLEPDRVSSVSR